MVSQKADNNNSKFSENPGWKVKTGYGKPKINTLKSAAKNNKTSNQKSIFLIQE